MVHRTLSLKEVALFRERKSRTFSTRPAVLAEQASIVVFYIRSGYEIYNVIHYLCAFLCLCLGNVLRRALRTLLENCSIAQFVTAKVGVSSTAAIPLTRRVEKRREKGIEGMLDNKKSAQMDLYIESVSVNLYARCLL